MNRNEIRDKILKIAEYTAGVDLSEDENLKKSGLDSLAIVAVIVTIEESFQISFNDEDLQPKNLNTLSDLIDLTEKYL